jgi:glycosyltransferase involved in cell wall biosynthesis
MQDLKFSIVIPSFNQGRFIESTLVSIIEQQYSNAEIIVIDGGSTDETTAILRKYAKHISYCVSEADHGQSHAIAKGFERATGDIFCWLNSDDVYLSGALRIVNDAFMRSRADVVYGNKQIIDNKGTVVSHRLVTPFLPDFMRDAYLCGGFGIYQPAAFWRRETYFRSGGIDQSLRFCMDNDLFNKFIVIGAYFQFVDKELAGFRVHIDSKTSTQRAVAEAESALLHRKYVHDRGVKFERLKRFGARSYRLAWFLMKGRLGQVLWMRYVDKLKWVP